MCNVYCLRTMIKLRGLSLDFFIVNLYSIMPKKEQKEEFLA